MWELLILFAIVVVAFFAAWWEHEGEAPDDDDDLGADAAMDPANDLRLGGSPRVVACQDRAVVARLLALRMEKHRHRPKA